MASLYSRQNLNTGDENNNGNEFVTDGSVPFWWTRVGFPSFVRGVKGANVSADRTDCSVGSVIWDILPLHRTHGNWILARETKNQ